MTTSTFPTRPRQSPPGAAPTGPTAMRLAPPKRQRSGAFIALAVLAAVLGALVFGFVYLRATAKTPVLAVARAVPAGQVIRSSDLAVTEISGGAGLSAISAENRSSVVGRTAAVPLAPGTLVSRAQLATSGAVGRGKVVIAVALKPGQAPPTLKPGDQVVVEVTGPAASYANPALPAPGGGQDPRGTVLIRQASVFDVDAPSRNNDNMTVSLLVDDADSASLAGAANVGLVTIGLRPAP